MLSAIVVRSLRYRRYRTAVDTVGTSLYTRRGEWSPLGLDHLGTSPLLACILRAAVPTAELAIARPSVDIIVSRREHHIAPPCVLAGTHFVSFRSSKEF